MATRLIDSRSTVFDAALDAIVTIDHDGRIVEINTAAERAFGFSRQEVRGRPIEETIIPLRYRRAHLQGFRRYASTGEPRVLGRRIQVFALRADGSEFPVELTLMRVPDVEPPLFAGFFRDLTDTRRLDRRRAVPYRVAELLASAPTLVECAPGLLGTLADAFEMAFAAIWIVDGDVLRCLATHSNDRRAENPFASLSRSISFVRGIGLPGRVWQSAHAHWIEEMPEDPTYPRAETARQQGLHSGFAFPVHLDEEVLAVIELYSTRTLERDDDLFKLLESIGRQVAQYMARKRAEEDRARLLVEEHRARIDAEQANRAKDDFLADVTHELRTPLNAILGWITLMKEGALVEARRDRAIKAIEHSARVQAQLIEDLLDVSRTTRGKLTIVCATIDAAAAVRAAVETIQPAAQERAVMIRATGVDDPVMIWADRARLQQIVWNLLSNAVKFSPKAAVIDVTLAAGPEAIQIEVKDNGVGIRPEFLPYLFERFRQDVRGQRGGLGLGLAIVWHLVEQHGGTVTAASDGEDKGSTFHITLPVDFRNPSRAPGS
jgi:PAS domain S-box-containing protein